MPGILPAPGVDDASADAAGGTAEDTPLSRQLGSMIPPIACSFVLVAALVACLGLTPRGSAPFLALLPRGDVAASSGAAALAGALANAGAVVALAAAFTYAFAALYRAWRPRAMHALTLLAFAAPLARLVLWCARGALDWPTAAAAAAQAGGGCAWAVVFAPEHGAPEALAHPALVVVCAALAWPFLCLDERSLWATLGALVVWDLFAVQAPCGPFRLVLDRRQERIWMSEPHGFPPGLIYETPSGFNLGTGDFLFYGVVAGRAAMRGAAPAAATAAGVLLGNVANVVWSHRSGGDSVPALPMAIAAGLAAYVAAVGAALPLLAGLGGAALV